MPESALQNWKKVEVRLVCFCLPCGWEAENVCKAAGFEREACERDVSYMDGHDRQVDVVEQLVVELHGHAGGEEDHQLLLAVLLQEGEEQQEALL